MKILTPIIGILVAIIIVFAVGKNIIIKTAVQGGVKATTGLSLNIQSLNLSLLKSSLGIKQMRLNNPKGFEDKTMVSIPEIFVDYNLGDIVKGNIHLEEMRLNLEEFTVIKNKEGDLNLDALKPVKEGKAAEKGEAPKEDSGEKGKAPKIQIDKLSLKVGKVIYKDYSGGGEPTIKEFNVNINQSYNNITDPKALVSLIVTKALMSTTIGNLVNIDLKGLAENLPVGLEGVTEGLGKITEKVSTDVIKETAKEALGESWDDTQKAAEELGSKFKELF